MTTSHTGMSTRLHVTKRAAAFLLLPLLLLLSACRVDASVQVTAAGGVLTDIQVLGDKEVMDMSEVSCASYGAALQGIPGDWGVTDSTQDDSDVLCQFKGFTENGVDGQFLIDNGSSYTLHLPIQNSLAAFEDIDPDITYSLAIHMPGEIVSATEGGDVDGSEVIYKGKIADFNKDIEVEASKSEGTSPVLWALGLLVLLLVGVVLTSKYLRKNYTDEDESFKFFKLLKGNKQSQKSSDSGKTADGVSASTTDSSVEVAPLPGKYSPKNIDGISESSYSEQIGLVDPVLQGSGADVVRREPVVLDLPSETSEVTPIPGMPPRIPTAEELAASVEADSSPVNEEDEDSLANNEAAAFFSSFLDDADDEEADEETDL